MNPTLQKLAISFFLLCAASTAMSVELRKVDAIFADYDSTNSPGCSMAVFQQGEIALARGFGLANIEYGIANRPSTVFRLASVSKQFTAMAIALLAEEGRLSLDDDIHEYFPALPDYGHPVTIRQLVHHTSGLRDYLVLAGLADWGDLYTVNETLEIIQRQQELNFPSGTEYLYSNTGYFLLSQIVEIVTGQSLREWADANMFEPLGMHNTHYHDDHSHIIRNRAYGYGEGPDNGYRVSMTLLDHVGDGGVFTTVEDLSLWDRNFYANSLGAGDPALIALVETPGSFNSGEKHDYAFGLGVREFEGVKEIGHSGGFDGFSTSTRRYPDHQLSVVVLCNDERAEATNMARAVAKLYLGIQSPAESGEGGSAESSSDTSGSNTGEFLLGAEQLEEFTGSYHSQELDYVMKLVIDDGSLSAVRRFTPSILEPKEQDVFTVGGYVTFEFARDSDGNIVGLTLQAGRVQNLKFVRQ